MLHAAKNMSQEFFEHFIRTEVSRHPSLSAALQSKSNLRKCSQQFERAVTELHYRLIKAAMQQLFSRVSSARLQELSSVACSTCETKYVNTETSPNTLSSQATDNEHVSSRWHAQPNYSQGLRPAPRSPPRSQVICGQQKNNDQSGSHWVKAENTAHNHFQQCQQQKSQHYQCQHQQTPEHHQPCQPQRSAGCTQPSQSASMTVTSPMPPPQPSTREGPSYSYPTAAHHNRRAMSGWYVANMDALLSNLMRLFEMIYRDTLQMCGVGACDLQQLRNALPDPTLISMQQRASGDWRPNFMNCKIDFLLHIAAMVYKNTQDIRSGSQCSIPTDPFWHPPHGSENLRTNRPTPKPSGLQQLPRKPSSKQPRIQLTASTCQANTCNVGVSWLPPSQDRPTVEANRNNHTVCKCQAITPSPVSPLQSPSPPPSMSRTFDGWDNNSNRANSASGCEQHQQRLERHRHCLRRAVGRSSATVLSSSFSPTRSTASSGQYSSQSSGSSSSAGDADTGNTCLSVSIKVPL